MLRLLLVLLALVIAAPAAAQIALVDSGTGASDGASTTHDVTGIDVSGSNTALYCAVVWASSTTAPTSATVTWDVAGANQSFGSSIASASNPSRGIALFTLKAPTGGTDKSITIANLNNVIAEASICLSFSGVDQTTPNDTVDSVEQPGTDTTLSSSSITSGTGDWIISFASNSDSTPNFAVTGTGQTLRATHNSANAVIAWADDRDGSTDTFVWTFDSGTAVGLLTFNLNTDGGGAGGSTECRNLLLLGVGGACN